MAAEAPKRQDEPAQKSSAAPVSAVRIAEVPKPDASASAAGAGPAAKPAQPQPAQPQAQPQPAQPKPQPAKPKIESPKPAAMRRPIAGPAVMRLRHYRIIASFGLCVLAPLLLSAIYLWGFARDQYISSMSFSVRTENMQSAVDMLGGLSSLAGVSGSNNDVQVIKQFIESTDMVRQVEDKVKLEDAFSLAWPRDFLFAYNPSGTLEDLHDYWNRSVSTSISDGLMTLKVRSYDPEMSYEISEAVFEASRKLINQLSQEAREDATRFTREDLDRAEERLKSAREAMTEFRLRTQIVDPSATLQAQMGILTTLQSQLAEALVQRDLLQKTARKDDPRIAEVTRRIDSLQAQISIEQEKFGKGGQGPGGEDYATLFSQYERLSSEQQFAEEAYRAAMVAHDFALTEAKLKSRYLAVHVRPTVAQKSLYPNRGIKLLVAGLFLFLLWSVGVLIYYSVRDRR